MNIFVLDLDPIKAASYLCNKHVPKMIVETAQLLSNAHPVLFAPYKRTHYNHPCSKWVQRSKSNYNWLCEHGLALCDEYSKRWHGKEHKTQTILQRLKITVPNYLPDVGLTEFALAIRDKQWHIENDPVLSYRLYYIAEKSRFAKWEPLTTRPDWWPASL